MLKTINFAGSPGLIADQPEHTLPENALSRVINIYIKPTGIIACRTQTPIFNDSTSWPLYIFPWRRAPAGVSALSAIWWVGLGRLRQSFFKPTATTVGQTLYNYPATTKFSHTVFSNVPIFTDDSFINTPRMFTPTPGEDFVHLTNFNVLHKAKHITKFYNTLIVMNVQRAGIWRPNLVHWSGPGEAGSVPNSWDHTSPATLSGQFFLNTDGEIITSKELGYYNIIYTQDFPYTMQFTGTNKFFNFERLSYRLAPLGPYAVGEVIVNGQGGHVVVTANDIVLHTMNGVQSIATHILLDQFFAELDISSSAYSNVQVIQNPQTRRVYVMFPTIGVSNLLRAYIWDPLVNNWTVRNFGGGYKHFNTGLVQDSSVLSALKQNREQLVGVAGENAVGRKQLDVLDYDFNNASGLSPGLPLIERLSLQHGADDTGRPMVAPEVRKYWKRAHFIIDCPNAVSIEFGAQEYITDAITWKPVQTFHPGQQTWVDIDMSGRFFSYRIQQQTRSEMHIAGFKIDFDVVDAGIN